ncbi:MAG TPA: Ig-like domain repeat protein, partial [Gemmataceae bacterium]|nr:Ig-like domain repeat protein [Gemmataceae bacterium]
LFAVGRVPTTTALTSSASPTTYGQTVVLTASVGWTAVDNVPVPTGVVYFYDGPALLGAGVLSGHQAVLNISNLSAGTHQLTARYGGDANYDASTSPVVVQQVNGLPTLGGVPVLARVDEGQALTFMATVANPGSPTFSLVGAPAGAEIDSATGAFSWMPTEDQGPGTFAFVIRLTDGATTDDRPITVQVVEVNTPPVLSAGVPAAVTTVPGSPLTFTAAATDADLINGLPNTLTFSLAGAPPNAWIDPDTGEFHWTPDESNPLGTYAFKVRVADDGVPSGHDTRTVVVTLTAAGLVDNGGVADLLVGGTGRADTIRVAPSADGTRIVVRRNGAVIGTFPAAGVTGRIVVHGLGGNDRVTVSGQVRPADLYGDTGNDTLTGGVGDDRLFGGPGKDRLAGGRGNDILVGGDGNDTLLDAVGVNLLLGGSGTDRLTGGAGDDLLTGGPTAYDVDPTGLASLLAEWASASPYTDRVAHLTGTSGGQNNGTFLTPAVTVIDDEVRDVLTGAKGADWFVAGTGDATDRKDPEQVLTV